MIETKTKELVINKTTIKKSLIIHECKRCGNTHLIHIEHEIENIDTSWEEEMIAFSDGYWCEKCNHVISEDENHTSTYVITSSTNDDFDIRKI